MTGLGAAAKHRFIELLTEYEVLQFGDFTLRSGRRSPYFFNLARIDDGRGMGALGRAYAQALVAAGQRPDVIFGPAYKGIPIATATAMALHAEHGINPGVAFDRKEAKAHGEAGKLVGHPLHGRVVVVDDVMTAGTAVLEAAELIAAQRAQLCGVSVALDREELLDGGRTALEELEMRLGVPVMSVVSLRDLIAYLESRSEYRELLPGIRRYQKENCRVQQ